MEGKQAAHRLHFGLLLPSGTPQYLWPRHHIYLACKSCHLYMLPYTACARVLFISETHQMNLYQSAAYLICQP